MAKLYLIFLILAVSGDLLGQEVERMDIPVTVNGLNPASPYVGGLLAPQFSEIDLDDDGVKDLFVFDRVGDVRLTFINEGTEGQVAYRFAPEYIDVFPEATHWVLLRDYNGDGIEDIFMSPSTPGIPGIEVWTGSRTNGELSYELVRCEECDLDILYIPITTGETQIYVSFIDIPEIRDIDGDGDLDILAFEPGGSTVNYYRNYSLERTGTLDILDYELEQNCFGKFKESGFSQDVELSPENDGCGSFLQDDPLVSPRHSGSTICAFDNNGDELMDLLLGDLSYNGLVMLVNGGEKEDAWIVDQDPSFPSYSTPIKINIYNAAYHIDVNNDGNRDLIAATNTRNALQNDDHILTYQNVNTDSQPVFMPQKMNFLVEDMLSFGSYSYPTFTDVNQDGLMDLVIGTGGFISDQGELKSKLYYFRNNGTETSPSFILQDDDYLEFSNFTSEIVYAPAFGDLDGDGDDDCLVGDETGFFFYLENIAGPDQPYDFTNPIYRWQEIRVGQAVVPAIADINKDGLGDIVIGERNFNSMTDTLIASLNYLENDGTVGNPIFNSISSGNNTQFFGRVNTLVVNNINNYSSPKLIPYRDDYLLITGSESGRIFTYTNIANNAQGTFEELSDDLGKIREGERTTVDIFDIDADGYYDIVVGNRRGGISFYATDIKNPTISTDDLGSTRSLHVFPNPASDVLNIDLEEGVQVWNATILGIDGKLINHISIPSKEIDISTLQEGVYIIEVDTSQGKLVSRFVKI